MAAVPAPAPSGPTLANRPTPRGRADQRGVYAPFIALIAAALLFLGGVAYDAPRILTARQDLAHAAREAARVAAATVAAGGSQDQARAAAETRAGSQRLVYGAEIEVSDLECEGTRVVVTVESEYAMRSILGAIRPRLAVTARGGAEVVFLMPHGDRAEHFYFMGECAIMTSDS